MKGTNTKASNNSISDKQVILCDFYPEFSEFRTRETNSRFGCESIDDNLYRSYKNGKIYFKNIQVHCPKCNSSKISLNAKIKRKLIFLNIGERICLVQQFKCKKCGCKIPTDLSSIVYPNSNITMPVINHIYHLYSFFAASLHDIRKSLKIEHNIDISHQTIENIILLSDFDLNYEDWSLSGYYLFDALWVMKNGEWKFLIFLFDVKINTIVSRSLLDSESTANIKGFLREFIKNQKVICITSDLKKEYRKAMDQLDIQQQYCLFHTKKFINKVIFDDINENKYSEKEINIINGYKQMIFGILDSFKQESAEIKLNILINEKEVLPNVIHDIVFDFIAPYFNKLTFHLSDENVESTTNKLENCFQKNFDKVLKRQYRSEDGILKRFNMRINKWDKYNRNL